MTSRSKLQTKQNIFIRICKRWAVILHTRNGSRKKSACFTSKRESNWRLEWINGCVPRQSFANIIPVGTRAQLQPRQPRRYEQSNLRSARKPNTGIQTSVELIRT